VRLHDVRKLAIAVVILVLASHRPAHADCGGRCPEWLDVMGYTFLIGITGGYAYGTGRFVYKDLQETDQSREYGATELTANGLLGAITTAGTVDSIRNGSVGGTLAFGSLTALHTTLAVHGGWRIYQKSGDLELPDGNMPSTPLLWIGGSLYGINTLFWLSEMSDPHDRAYGITEAAVNAPIAVGLGYLAYNRFETFRGGPGLLYTGMAATSTVLVVHGLRTAIWPHHSDNLDMLPIAGDGPGLSVAGRW
jgi:hypothetical protein